MNVEILGIFLRWRQLQTHGPCAAPRELASTRLPRPSKPNSLGDSWTSTLCDEGKLRLDHIWNPQLWANVHKITVHQGTEEL